MGCSDAVAHARIQNRPSDREFSRATKNHPREVSAVCGGRVGVVELCEEWGGYREFGVGEQWGNFPRNRGI